MVLVMVSLVVLEFLAPHRPRYKVGPAVIALRYPDQPPTSAQLNLQIPRPILVRLTILK